MLREKPLVLNALLIEKVRGINDVGVAELVEVTSLLELVSVIELVHDI